MGSNFNCSYMAVRSLTYIPGFSVKFFFRSIYTDYIFLFFPWNFSFSRFISIMQVSHIFNNSHLEWRAGLSDIILKGTHPRTIQAKFDLIWFSGFRREDLNQTWQEFSLGGSLSKLCPTALPSIQDGCCY
jgi:hypothetical protein